MRHSPQTPYRVKAKGKEISRDSKRTVYRARARRGVAADVAEAVEKALKAFGGTRGPTDSDEAIWASIAWRVGAENFYHAVIDKIGEDNADGKANNPAAAFQKFLNERFPKPTRKGGAK